MNSAGCLQAWLDRYTPPDAQQWTGRIDSKDNFDAYRWHQWIQPLDLSKERCSFNGSLGIVLIGFCSEEGVRRNLGRTGAAKGPQAIRKELCNLPCWFTQDLKLYDAGDVQCPDGDLEGSQAALASMIRNVLDLGLFPIVLGGGHETAYGHFHGLKAHHGQAPAIINFDAHLDLRPYPNGGTSGTMFRQIVDDCVSAGDPWAYLCVGVQRYGNTVDLFKTAERLGVQHILSKDLARMPPQEATQILSDFTAAQDHLHVTICADVFSSAFAPDVSATQPLGLDPELALLLLRHLFHTRKVRGLDICEISPRYDQDCATASLAKVIVFSAVHAMAQLRGLSID